MLHNVSLYPKDYIVKSERLQLIVPGHCEFNTEDAASLRTQLTFITCVLNY